MGYVGGVVAVDVDEFAEAADAADEFFDEAFEGVFVPFQAGVQGDAAAAVWVDVGAGGGDGFVEGGLLFAFAAQGVEGFVVGGDAFEVEPEGFEGGLFVFVHDDHLFGEVGEQVVDGVVAVSGEFSGDLGKNGGVIVLFIEVLEGLENGRALIDWKGKIDSLNWHIFYVILAKFKIPP